MRISKRCGSNRRLLLPLMVLGLMILLAVVTLNWFETESQMPLAWHVDPNHRKLVHSFVRGVLSNQCRPAFARKGVEARLQSSSHVTDPFLWRDTLLTREMFKYPPPFGFRDMHGKLKDVLNLLPAQPEQLKKECRRCVVLGNGGILRGLELGTLLDQFDVVIRLNSGPLRNYSKDVGNRTSIRMSYPEGSPKVWEDVDPELLFVAVVYKAVDFKWIRAMINRQRVSLWDWLFFWQKVPEKIPVDLSKFRVLNLEIIRQMAMDLLAYSSPQKRLWGWDQNVPTMGISALNLATYLCDEVSLAGFGYNLSQKETPLHYYDNIPMTAMLGQNMHNVDRERALLQSLVREGTVSDLTGGLHCTFCPS
ncbi:lactosylceramide alpha-2,3-sialyltransferase [Oncorhynchus kisutch]|uniref:lactosylceramide alpha-2,3-sialyltransferase n=1 Tax=Oncorhynchus kisutch TaxID=8019 RepID=UPI0009A02031|nr:lactosylceramide alpha-2,3-sialyltransferase [Oncorhynchus kisutch]